MAQDYHIYLHSEGNGSSGNKTQPFSMKNENNESGNAFATKAQKAFSIGSSAMNGSMANTGVAALAKAIPALAVIYAIAKVVDKVLTTGFALQEEYTGNYKNNVQYNNFKTHISNAIHPVRYAFNIIHQNMQINKQNKEIAEQNKLIGNSILKDFNIGV